MPSDWAPELVVYDGIAFGELSSGDAEFNQLMVSSRRGCHGRLLPLDVISLRNLGNRSSRQALICGVNYLFAGDARSARFCPIVMQEELRKKNRRLFVAILVFAIGFTVLIILWKLSIYQKT